MLDKAPNGKVTNLPSALDKAPSTDDVDRVIDLFQTDCYWRDPPSERPARWAETARRRPRDILPFRAIDPDPLAKVFENDR